MITVQVLLFSTVRARIGKKKLLVELPAGSSVANLKELLAGMYPEAGPTVMGMLASVNQIFSDDKTEIPDQGEVAFFPHVAGG